MATNDGANEGFWRFQIRDKYGNWVKMGGSVTFSTNHPNFGPVKGNGLFQGGSRPGVALVKISDNHPTLAGKVVEVPSEDFQIIKAIIPADAPGLAKAKILDALDGKIVNAPTAPDIQIKSIKEASEPWKKIDTWVEDRGEFTLDNNFYGTIIDFRRNFASPVSAVDAEMISKEHKDALKIYTGNGYRIINNHLRYKHESDYKQAVELESKIAAIDEMILENGEVFENSRVFRGQYLDTPLKSTDTNWIETMENLEVGDIISDPGYMSTSNDPIIAFMEFGPGRSGADWISEDAAMSSSPVMSGSVLWMVDVPKGSKAFALPEGMGYGQGGEREVILPRDSQLKVKGIRRVQQLDRDFEPLEGKYNYYVQADLVPQDTPGVIDVVDETAEERGAVDVKSISSIADLVAEYEDLTSRIEALDDSSKSKAEKGNIAMQALLEMMGKNNKPELVNSLEDLSGSPIYRGAGKLSLESMKNSDSDRIGLGYTGDGYYFSDVKATATDYAGMQEYETDPGEVITASWKTDAKVYNFESIKKLQKEAGNRATEAYDELQNKNLDSEAHDEVYVALFISSYESLVSSLILEGYDGMTIFNSEDDETYTVVFNRGALQIVNN